jgi:ribosome-binding protein aMBF1 (putative translation factor)
MTKMQQARDAKKWSQTKIAYMAGMAQSDVSAMENGWRKPYPGQAKRLAKLLGLKPEELTEPADNQPAA